MRFILSKDGWTSQFKSALIVASALGVVTFLQQVNAVDFGLYESLVFGVISWLVSFIKNWLEENFGTSEAE